MTILSDRDILPLLRDGLITQRDGTLITTTHVNSASIDICIGYKCMLETTFRTSYSTRTVVARRTFV